MSAQFMIERRELLPRRLQYFEHLVFAVLHHFDGIFDTVDGIGDNPRTLLHF